MTRLFDKAAADAMIMRAGQWERPRIAGETVRDREDSVSSASPLQMVRHADGREPVRPLLPDELLAAFGETVGDAKIRTDAERTAEARIADGYTLVDARTGLERTAV